VTFDIDANGIVHVSAKDLATGKEQRIRIESSSGLSDQDIERMVKDAEAHQQEDQQKKRRIETRNNADAMVYQCEKLLKESGDKVDAADKNAVEAAVDGVKKALEKDDTAAIESAMEALTQAQYRLSEALYKSAAGPAQSASDASKQQGPQRGADDAKEAAPGGDTVDADFTVVDEDDKKENRE